MKLDRKPILSQAFDLIDSYLELEKESNTIAYLPPKELAEKLDVEVGKEVGDWNHLFSELKQILDYTPRTGSPVFFNQLFAGKNIASMVGELVSVATNTSMYTYKVAGAQIFVEKAVINKMLSLAGMKGGEGTFVPGGSLSNMTASLAAINRINPDHREKGMGGKTYTAYATDECHYSLKKNMGIVGLGRENLRKVRSDEDGKMDAKELRRMVEEDISEGKTPFMVIATSGTTVRGAFDPIDEIAEVTREYGLWLHIDAAFGGTLLIDDKYAENFKGIEHADSLTWDPHKLMGTPLITSAILFRKKGTLKSVFCEDADYLFQTEADEYNPGNQSLQCGRRNDSLKLWTTWRYYGDKGLKERLEKQMSLAKHAADLARQSEDINLVFEPTCVNVCFNYEDVAPEDICNELDRRGIAKIGYGTSGNQKFIRLVTANPDLEFSDIDKLMENIRQMGKSVRQTAEISNA